MEIVEDPEANSLLEVTESTESGPISPSQPIKQERWLRLVWTTFYYNVQQEEYSKDVFLTRQLLWDRELVKLSAILPEDFANYQAFSPNEILDLGQMELPSEKELKKPVNGFVRNYGDCVKDNYYPQPQKNDNSQEWITQTTAEEYWSNASTYLVYKIWLQLFEQSMDKQTLDDTYAQMMENKPINLLPAHQKLQDYENECKNLPEFVEAATFDEKYQILTQFLEKQIQKDFSIAVKPARSSKARAYLRKIEEMGFATGFNKNTFKVADDVSVVNIDDQGSLSPEKNQAIANGPKRQKVVYDEKDIFYDVDYEIYESRSMRMVLGQKNEEKAVVSTNDTPEQASETPIDFANFSFAFNEENDAHLVAQDAYKIFKFDREIRKYWYQRFRLFSKLNKGVLMDREGWFSVTPEKIASHIAERIVTREGMVIIDGFAGVGGNSIQFALRGAYVIAVDLDPIRLKCAKRNAEVYGVADRIEFICGNYFHVLSRWTSGNRPKGDLIDAVFLSPPWGGPSYLHDREFDIGTGCCPNGFDIFEAAKQVTPNIAYFLPRNTKYYQIVGLAGRGGQVEVEQSCLNKKIKTITAYYGNLCCGAPRESANTTIESE